MTLVRRRVVRGRCDADATWAFLAARAVAGVEEHDPTTYRRALRLPSGAGLATVRRGRGGELACRIRTASADDVEPAFAQLRRVLGLDLDVAPARAHLAHDPILRPLVLRYPRQCIPGAVAGDELVARAVIGQQVSVAGARTLLGRIVRELGQPLADAHGTITRLFPDAATLADASDEHLPLPASRRDALRAVSACIANRVLDVDAGADAAHVRAVMGELPGIGPWTTEYVLMRAVRDADAFPAGDLVLRAAYAALAGQAVSARELAVVAERWRPWRALAAQLLWRSAAVASG